MSLLGSFFFYGGKNVSEEAAAEVEAAGEKQAEAAARIDTPPDRSGRRGGREKGLSTGDVKHEWREVWL